jgi:hypothetical protein
MSNKNIYLKFNRLTDNEIYTLFGGIPQQPSLIIQARILLFYYNFSIQARMHSVKIGVCPG